MYFSFFLSWHTTKMTPQSRATIIITIMAGTSTMGSIPTTGELRASKAENTLLINYRLSCMLHKVSHFSDLRLCLPLQFKPFSASRYPTSQLQAKLPMVLLHICSHPPFAVSHSLMSIEQEDIPLYIALCQDTSDPPHYNSHALMFVYFISNVFVHNQSYSM